MFSLDDSMRYWLFTEPTDMRKSFHMLSGIVNNQMSADLRNGDVFIFVNKNRNRIKLLRKEPGGLVIYAMMLDYGRLRLPSVEQGAISRALEWRDLAGMIRHVIEDVHVCNKRKLEHRQQWSGECNQTAGHRSQELSLLWQRRICCTSFDDLLVHRHLQSLWHRTERMARGCNQTNPGIRERQIRCHTSAS